MALVAALSELADLPDDIPRLVRDPNDDYLIACALAGHADFIISGDKDLLEWKAGAPFKILSARQLLSLLED